MRNLIYLILSGLFLFASCSDDEDKETAIKEVRYVDISDFSVYNGSSNGDLIKLQYNDLKNRVLVSQFFGSAYAPNFYQGMTIEFNGDILTYVDNINSNAGKKILSQYEFKDDALYIWNADTLKFVAYGTNPNDLYMLRGLARYPLKYTVEDEGEDEDIEDAAEVKTYLKDTVVVFNSTVELDAILRRVEPDVMKVDTAVIAICNVKYLFY